MKEGFQQLGLDIQHKIGYKIKSTKEAVMFTEELHSKVNCSISLSTIRRFYGLIPYRNPQKATLDALAQFLGFSSFSKYNQYRIDSKGWIDELTLIDIKKSPVLEKKHIKYLNQLSKNKEFPIVLSRLFEFAYIENKKDFLCSLFQAKELNLFQYPDHINSVVFKTAFLIYNTIELSTPRTQLLNALLKLELFRDYIIYNYIKSHDLNRNYGSILKQIQKSTKRPSEQLFLSLILELKSYYNLEEIQKIGWDEEELTGYPVPLIGRYWGYQLLFSSYCENEAAYLQALDSINTFCKHNSKSIPFFLFEVVLALLLIKRIDTLTDLMSTYYEEMFESNHFHTDAERFLYTMADAYCSIQQEDLKTAMVLFESLRLDLLGNSSWKEQFMLFYSVLGYQLCVGKKQQIHLEAYLKLSSDSGYLLFDANYIENYLSMK